MDYDLAIIGAGWAGFSAAMYARENGLNTCLIEKDKIGGTCLNRGCIPTKAFVQSAKALSHLQKIPSFGVKPRGAQFDFQQAQNWRKAVIEKLSRGMDFRVKKSGVDYIQGAAKIISPNEIEAANKKISAKFILVATGSRPARLPRLAYDSRRIVSSDHALEFTEVPEKLLIVGGGFIGCEFASIYGSFGSEVTIVEMLERLLPVEDAEASRKIESAFRKKKIKVLTKTDLFSLKLDEFDKVLVAIGRVADTEGLFDASLGIKTEKGRIVVDDHLRAGVGNIYSAGDASSSIQLAHLAAYEGRLAVRNMLNPDKPVKRDTRAVPTCIFTEPEVASVGLNEEAAKKAGINYLVKKLDFPANGMAQIMNETDGFIKILVESGTGPARDGAGRILGATIVGPSACELIALLTCAVNNNLSKDSIDNTIFAHPSLSELIQETLRQ
ncbi:MAG: dihydrolipoyl dehydrogenase [Candidatus Omnitrophica bacterium]|nr:dihydrolipoyl dehydrogenase [Candidatus Omnitrophota bacterium]